MAKSTEDSREKVSLEELLQFKRAERPEQSFWDEFDRGLHQRMMQTLVKKDPWPVQLLRGFTGKLAQSTAIAAAAAVLAIMVIRPAFVASGDQHQPALATVVGASLEISDSAAIVSADLVGLGLMAEADYEIEGLTASAANSNDAVTQDYGLDRIEVASYDSDAYSADMAFSGFASTGVASLVY